MLAYVSIFRICSEYFQAQSYKFLKNIEAHEKLWYSYKEVCNRLLAFHF